MNVLKSAGYLIPNHTEKIRGSRPESALSALETSTVRSQNAPPQPSFKNVAAQVPFDPSRRYSMPAKADRTASSFEHGTQASKTSRPEWLSKALSVSIHSRTFTPRAICNSRALVPLGSCTASLSYSESRGATQIHPHGTALGAKARLWASRRQC